MPFKRLFIIIIASTMLQGCITFAVLSLISGTTTVAKDERSLGNFIDDQTIELNAYAELKKNSAIDDNTHIFVTSINGSVLIVGQAPNMHLKDVVAKTIVDIDGVETIHNQIRIANKSSVKTRSNDVWLTSKVKMALFKNEKLDAINIKVVTENSEVFLMGVIDEPKAQNAIEIARNVTGVNRVFNAFEYIEE